MPLVISLFSLSKPSFLYADQKKVQSSFYNFDLSATSLLLQKKKTLSCDIENTRDLKSSKNKDNFENKLFFEK